MMLHSFHADPNLADADYRVLGALLYWAYDKPDCWPCVETIARRVCKKVRAVQVALKNLEHFGYIRMDRDPTKRTGRRIVLVWRECGEVPEADEVKDSPRKIKRQQQASRRNKAPGVHTCAHKEEGVSSDAQESLDCPRSHGTSPQLEVTLSTVGERTADDGWEPPKGGTPDRQRERLIVHLATLAALERRKRKPAVNSAASLFVELLMDEGSLDFHRRVCWAVAKGKLSGNLVADAFRATYDQIVDREVGVLGAYYVGCLRNMIGDEAVAALMTELAEDPEGAAEEYGCIPLAAYRESVA